MSEQDRLIQEAIKARLKAEGIGVDEGQPEPAPKQRTKAPAPLPDGVPAVGAAPEAEKPAESSGREDIDDALSALDEAEKTVKAEQKKNEGLPPTATAALAGAGAGTALRLKGKESPFQPKPTEQNIRTVNEINADIARRQASIAKIEDQLRAITQNPNAKIGDFTADQVQRILQGGEGPTMGTSGAQRGYGYQGEQQRRARHQDEVETRIRQAYPGLSDPVVKAGQLVPLKSGIQVPTNVATDIAQQQIQAQAEQQKANLNRQLQSEQNKISIGQSNIDKEMNLAKSRGYRAGAGKVGMGALGGAQTGMSVYDLYQKWQRREPIDWQDWARLGGSFAQAVGGPRTGVAGGLATLPWAIKHKEELLRGMTGADVNPTAMPAGTSIGDEPIYRDTQTGR